MFADAESAKLEVAVAEATTCRLVPRLPQVPLAVNVAVAPTGRLTVARTLPVPGAGQVAPPAAAQVQVGVPASAGKVD